MIDMDDTSIKGSLRDFESVWERVSQQQDTDTAAPDRAPGESERLRAFMLSAGNAAALYAALARRFKGAAPVLTRLAADERAHLRALELEYYLLTGDSFTPPARQPEDGAHLLSTLRGAWQAEGRSEQSYLHAASISELGPLYRAHAENERRHRAMLRELISRVMQ